MAVERFVTARDRLLRVGEDADMALILDETVAALHEVTAFSRCAVLTVDPWTLLPTGGVVEGFPPEACGPFWDNELLSPGFNKFRELARSTETVATLVEATDGDIDRAPIYTDLYASLGIADEMRAAFVLGTTCWGIAVLARDLADGAFPDHQIDEVRRLAPVVARVLRSGACRLDADAHGRAAVIVVDEHNEIRDLTADSRALLDELRISGVAEPGLPSLIGVVARRARRNRTSTHVATRVCGTSGRWLRVAAAPMEGGEGYVAVTIEPARPGDLVPIVIESYGLTPREVEIVLLLARGFTTKAIAAELALSSHTVRDHVKTVLARAGVSSRGELVARLFTEHLLDGFENALRHVV
ncbi:helix-turn-helix transcriptional regulator [Pseudonocardia alaniniphila]|uniref:helix-turn-helix transcriptional regulator n=1 Tax=Pseudonocardia alaniniphila TaxID=75291 RepID=UPI001F1296F8|nr:helix-turn-helix transcriptional regulator [Pseudonocardia alaniniphila]